MFELRVESCGSHLRVAPLLSERVGGGGGVGHSASEVRGIRLRVESLGFRV